MWLPASLRTLGKFHALVRSYLLSALDTQCTNSLDQLLTFFFKFYVFKYFVNIEVNIHHAHNNTVPFVGLASFEIINITG